MKVLGIESSCDETACAIVEDGKTILSNVVATQIPFHKIYKGVVPEIASRKHAEWILPVVRQALKEANMTLDEVDAIAATGVETLDVSKSTKLDLSDFDTPNVTISRNAKMFKFSISAFCHTLKACTVIIDKIERTFNKSIYSNLLFVMINTTH